MQEIAPSIFIDHNALGMVTGIIRTEEGTVLVDSPLRQDEVKSWRSSTARLVTGNAKYLICLDTNYDRLVSSKGTECVTIMQENILAGAKARNLCSRLSDEAYPYPEGIDMMVGNSRWMPPEIVYSEDMQLYLDDFEIRLEHHYGSNHAGTWVILHKQKIVFIGDTVVVEQAPFLAYADLLQWQEDLQVLASKSYKGYQIISARSGLVSQEQVRKMGKMIAYIAGLLQPLQEQGADLEAYYDLLPKILKKTEVSEAQTEMCFNRLRWGLTTYYEQFIDNQKGDS